MTLGRPTCAHLGPSTLTARMTGVGRSQTFRF
jgi:hypothetical protein